MVSGPAITAGFDGRTITVGNLGTLAHPVWGPAGRAVTDGVHAYIDDYNARGGVASRYKVAIVDQDTSYDPATAMQLFAQSKDKVALFASMFGTPIVTSVLPLLQQNQMAAVPASGDAEWTLKGNLVPTGGVLQVHAINGIVWFYEQAGNATKRMCSLYVDSSYGKAGQEGVEFAARFLNRAFGPSIALGLTDTQLLGPSIQFRANGCDAIVVTGTPSQATALLLQSSQLGYTPQLILVGPTYNDAQVVPANSELYGRYAVVSSDGVNWGDTSVKGMADLTAAIRRHAKQYVDRPELAFLQGWMQARTAMAVLEKAVELGDLSRPGVLRAIGQVGKVGFDGLVSAEWDYVDPSKRTVPPANAIFAVDPSYPLGLRLIQKGYTSNAAKAYRP